ncbi:hypothetical protein [Parasphingorhabdus marina]|nr:hypothetical protein [Parasphingorhabdus marina]
MAKDDDDTGASSKSSFNLFNLVATLALMAATLVITWATFVSTNSAGLNSSAANVDQKLLALYENYFRAAEIRISDPEAAENQLFIICELIGEKIPNYDEFDMGLLDFGVVGGQIAATHELQLNRKEHLEDLLRNPRLSGTKPAKCLEDIDADKEVESERSPTSGGNSSDSQPPPTTEQEAARIEKSEQQDRGIVDNLLNKDSRGVMAAQSDPEALPVSLTVKAGARRGYAIDVFWCENSDPVVQQKNLQEARQIADFLKSRTLLGGNLAIGRVRLRTLLTQRQGADSYPASGRQVRREAAEASIGENLVAAAGEATGEKYSVHTTSNTTDYYLSVFSCGG